MPLYEKRLRSKIIQIIICISKKPTNDLLNRILFLICPFTIPVGIKSFPMHIHDHQVRLFPQLLCKVHLQLLAQLLCHGVSKVTNSLPDGHHSLQIFIDSASVRHCYHQSAALIPRYVLDIPGAVNLCSEQRTNKMFKMYIALTPKFHTYPDNTGNNQEAADY